jgi:G:T-mismatch repair DNA endonuclease (very short patch repair protein)
MGVNNARTEEMAKYLSKENLEKYLPIYSANYIAKKLFAPEFTTYASQVIAAAKRHGLKTNTIKESANLKHVRNSYKNTCKDKYGVINISQVEKIKKKKVNSAIKKYGVINVFQAEEVKEKSKQTCLRKYGTEYFGHLSPSSSGNRSSFHKNIEKILTDNEINFESEVTCKFKKFNKDFNKVYSPIVDILLDEYKLVIECNGDFWHANPKSYKSTDIFYCWEGKTLAQEIWDRDKSRIKQIRSFGYKVLVIWESDYTHNRQKTTKRILNVIENQKNKQVKNKK